MPADQPRADSAHCSQLMFAMLYNAIYHARLVGQANHSTLKVLLNAMRYINPRFACLFYLVTYTTPTPSNMQ